MHASTVAVGHCKDGGNDRDSSALSFSTDSRAGSKGNRVSRLPHLAAGRDAGAIDRNELLHQPSAECHEPR
eukprot:6011071-Lingulodinium_polyedra.AAC.1